MFGAETDHAAVEDEGALALSVATGEVIGEAAGFARAVGVGIAAEGTLARAGAAQLGVDLGQVEAQEALVLRALLSTVGAKEKVGVNDASDDACSNF